MKLRHVAALLCALPLAAPQAQAETTRGWMLQPTSVRGCPGVPVTDSPRELVESGRRAVDVRARFWALDRPGAFENGRAERRYRIGSGILRVASTLSADRSRERIDLSIEQPVEPAYAAVYLNGIDLPCERIVHFDVADHPPSSTDLDALAAFDAHLHASAELLYEGKYAAARARLERAAALRPQDPAPYWMLARLIFLELEASDPRPDRSRLIEVYENAEHLADEAVRRAPDRAEGYLWQGIARGRIATTLGNVRTALAGALGGRGPAWLERTLQKATSLPEEYHLFGFTTRADAYYALAQYYRLAPEGWYMHLVGTSGDRDLAVKLARRAVDLQPTRIEYRKELAVALLCRGAPGDPEAAADQLRAVLDVPTITAIDRVDHQHARMLLETSPRNVCWYSRDGFLEEPS